MARKSICNHCHKEFQLATFAKSRAYCYDCMPKELTAGGSNGAKIRNLIKKWAMEYKGGKCAICGYHDFISALDFHHLDPNKKDFQISDRNLKYGEWDKITQELDKTIILCANCHRALHYGDLQLKRGDD